MKIYDNLIPIADSISDSDIEIRWHQVCPVIANLTDIHRDLLYAIILHYAETETKIVGKGKNNAPFGGKSFSIGKGLMFSVENIPLKLQKIILGYVSVLMTE